jgi:phage-related protein
MLQDWKILYYETTNGNSPIYDFISWLTPQNQAKISNTLDLLAQYGTFLGSPHVKKITGTDLWELRILGTNNIRIFYVAFVSKTFVLLHGFLKKKQKTDKKEIKTALERLREFSSRKRS